MAIQINIPDGPILDAVTSIHTKDVARKVAAIDREIAKSDDQAVIIQLEAQKTQIQAQTTKLWIIQQMKEALQRFDLEQTKNDATQAARGTIAQAVVDRGIEIAPLDDMTNG